ncbi:class III poly(R)-hydroxyalkanoic acid synthase subunit PhaE [Luteimonas vadosa]|uniref:Poly(3-hydroxyalkanoate) polymerase subunit PhaE n=1 Tax=Luteimonas vadosa TaxID=1165507 RepID=A0ABP9E0E9_9GAMM
MAKPEHQENEFETLARQYWGAWGDAMRQASAPATPSPGMAGAKAWHDAMDWWARAARGEQSQANVALDQFNAQAKLWYGQMQQVAAQFAGQDAGAGEITRAWKEALGAAGHNPFPEMLRSMRGPGLQGMDQWIEDASPFLSAFRDEGASWLRLPQFGFAREHQERAQRLAEAQMEVQQQASAYNALMLKASQSAYEIFESKLAEREEPGRQLDSPRALFDLWIDAAEEAYAEIALSPEFRTAYGNLVNAQMRLRGAVQQEVEQASAMFGMPTRSELDGAHRKIVELERAVRRMRDAMPATTGGATQAKTRPTAGANAGTEPKAPAKAKAKTSAKAKAKPKSLGARARTRAPGKGTNPRSASKPKADSKKATVRKPGAAGKGKR